MRCPPPPAHALPLLKALRQPSRAAALPDDDWDRVLRIARRARLHGVLAHRLAALGERLPPAVASQLAAARAEAAYTRAMVQHELTEVRRALATVDADLLLLKGGGYIAQNLECANGRIPADLDVLVRRDDFERVEDALRQAGWQSAELNEYDAHYYRRWAHQAPPLRAVGHAVELDLHHAILPPRGRVRIDTEKLWSASVPIDGPALRVLSRADQVLHAVVHLFVDSDCTNRMHALVDIASLIDEFARADSEFVGLLRARARTLGIARSLAHAEAFVSEWLASPSHGDAGTRTFKTRMTRALIARRLAPPDPDAMPAWVDPLHRVLLARSVWLRLPAHLALAHAISRPFRRAASN